MICNEKKILLIKIQRSCFRIDWVFCQSLRRRSNLSLFRDIRDFSFSKKRNHIERDKYSYRLFPSKSWRVRSFTWIFLCMFTGLQHNLFYAFSNERYLLNCYAESKNRCQILELATWHRLEHVATVIRTSLIDQGTTGNSKRFVSIKPERQKYR